MSADDPTLNLPYPEGGGAILGLWVGAAAFGNILAITLIINNVLLQYPHLSARLSAALAFWKKDASADQGGRSHEDLSPSFTSSASRSSKHGALSTTRLSTHCHGYIRQCY